MSGLLTFLEAAWSVTLELAPWLLLGSAIAGALHVVVPPDFIRRAFTGHRGVLAAVALGVPLPLCSCGVIPAGLGLKKDGASDGAAVGFLISTPQTGVDSVLVSASFLGWPFALFKVGAAAVTGILGGWIAETASGGTPQLAPETPKESPVSAEAARQRSFGAALEHALEVLQSIWKWLLFGVLLSAAITTVLPPSWLASVGTSGTWLPVLLALVISLPLYVCATASVPIAAALVAGGFPVGAALVFLMAGPATNLATVGAVYRGLGRRTMLIYVGTIVVGSVALAYAFEFVMPAALAQPAAHHDHETSWFALVSAVGLCALLTRFAASEGAALWRARVASKLPAQRGSEVGVDGMTCGGCVRKLQRQLDDDPRVDRAEVLLEPGLARVWGTLDGEAVGVLVAQAGFTARPSPGPPSPSTAEGLESAK